MCAFIAVMGERALQRLEGEMSGSEAVNHDVVCALAVQHDLALGRAAHLEGGRRRREGREEGGGGEKFDQ